METHYGIYLTNIIMILMSGQMFSKKNQNKIYDADLILPGQSLIIHKNISDRSREKAREYAKTRGLWVVGYREESDIIFLENDK